MKKKTILYVIDNLGRGGAETLLVGILPELNTSYRVILVTLSDECEFKEELIICFRKYSLGFKGKFSFLSCIIKLKKIIRLYHPDLVHAHLLNSTIVARLACPATIPIACSVHSLLNKNVFEHSWIYRNLEKWLFKKKHYLIAVSKEVLRDYEKSIAKPGKSFVLTNYVADVFVNKGSCKNSRLRNQQLKLVAVGNIRKVKNYEYLLQCLLLLKALNISLDIYGKGEPTYLNELQQTIKEHNLPVIFKGICYEVADELPKYDLYVMPSLLEGFGIAAIEAMAMGLPLALSNLAVLKEVTYNNALFFKLNDPSSLATILKNIYHGRIDVSSYSSAGISLVKQHYTKAIYLHKIDEIYTIILR